MAMVAFLQTGQDCFVRTTLWAHFTGSALLIDHTGTRVLLNHHRALDRWLHFGGHADGDPDLFAVAQRELAEESGITACVPLIDGPFDIDIHPIPYNAKRNEPAHLHYDVRYLFRMTTDVPFAISDESIAMRWCRYEEARTLAASETFTRMLDKWRAAVKA
ncbi:MAG: NUDIX hydrolase [Alphaproteobacteria bacterium]|nr:NUDIX hydrolase [Alphaproteobacteria bacterium]MBU0859393.1 NUDIX hydrolase [Alphaproteobacteria bacterium]